MNNLDIYLITESDINLLSSIEGVLNSLGLPKYDKIPPKTLGYLKSGKKSIVYTIYSDDRISYKSRLEKSLQVNNIGFSDKHTAKSSVPITVIYGPKVNVSIVHKPAKGTGGSGAGAYNTKLQETAQSLFLSLSFNITKRKIKESDVTDKSLQEAYTKVDLNDVPLEELISFSSDPSWLDTFIKTTNLIYSKYYNGGNYTFERDSRLVKEIYKTYNTLRKDIGIQAKDDKWNPSDIWLVHSKISSLPKFKTLTDFNSYLVEKFVSGELIGISLKKLDKKPTLSVHNLDPVKKSKIYSTYTISPKSKDWYLESKDGLKIQFRSFNNLGSYQAEIKSKTGRGANHGKVGYGVIYNYFSKYGSTKLFQNQIDVRKLVLKKSPEFIQDFLNLYNKYIGVNFNETDLQEFVKQNVKSDVNDWYYSKYLSLTFVDSLESMTNKGKDEVIDDLYGYASSNSDFSSVFVKIS